MAKTALQLTSEERQKYQPIKAIEQRRFEKAEEIRKRRGEGYRLAQKAADLLKSEFDAEKVVLFGSLVGDSGFTLWSDIDLAAWGIPSTRFYESVAAITGMSSKFRIDLVDPDTCRPGMREAIEQDGIEL